MPEPQQAALPSTLHLRNLPSAKLQDSICRDFVWGTCTKGAKCKFRHKLHVNSMKNILKFCHDYQNRTGCNRPDCAYLHSTREEEGLFLTTGQMPKALVDRYAAISSPSMNIYMNEIITRPPPPPPPAYLAPPPAHVRSPPPYRPLPPGILPPLRGQLSPPWANLRLPPPPPPPAYLRSLILQPPPPPPPPTVASNPSNQIFHVRSLFNGPTILSLRRVLSSPPLPPTPPPPPMFDANRPPPRPRGNRVKNAPLKRPADSTTDLPNKVKKDEDSLMSAAFEGPYDHQGLRFGMGVNPASL